MNAICDIQSAATWRVHKGDESSQILETRFNL